jgi:hypothetical protein
MSAPGPRQCCLALCLCSVEQAGEHYTSAVGVTPPFGQASVAEAAGGQVSKRLHHRISFAPALPSTRIAVLGFRWGRIGATPEPSSTNAPNARVAPARPEKVPEMTGGPRIWGLRWWAILGLNQ